MPKRPSPLTKVSDPSAIVPRRFCFWGLYLFKVVSESSESSSWIIRLLSSESMIAFDETDEARLLSAFVPFVLLRRPRLLAEICTAEVGDSVGTTKPFCFHHCKEISFCLSAWCAGCIWSYHNFRLRWIVKAPFQSQCDLFHLTLHLFHVNVI